MPIYRYRCEDCEHVMEVLAKPSDDKPEACEACGSGNVQKVISRTSFQLRGGGWYAQGYSQAGSASGSSASTSGDAGSSKSSSDSGASAATAATSSDD